MISFPAKAGTQELQSALKPWAPAFAGEEIGDEIVQQG
jgi:hypothetical protein